MRLRRTSMACVVALGCAALPAAASAQATRTWVSGTGSDANPCSRTAPCQTWAGAISKTATGGEIDALDSGGFGAVTITKSITLQAVGLTAGVLVAGTDAIVINTSGDTASPGDPDRDVVTLRGLDIDGLGATNPSAGISGVVVIHAGTVRLDGDEIFGFSQAGVNFGPTPTTETGAPPPKLVIESTSITDNGQAGVRATPAPGQSARVLVENSTIENNGCGLAAGLAQAVFTTTGCGTSGTGTGTVEIDSANSSISNNTGAGILSDGATATNALSADLIIGNGTGLSPLGGGLIESVGANSVFANTSEGSPTSTVTTGIAGPVGPQGPAGQKGDTGAAGAAGKAGTIELVTCKTVTIRKTEKVHGKIKHVNVPVQKCSGRAVSGSVTFTATGVVVKATISRAGRVYATGTMRIGRAGTAGDLRIIRSLGSGSYELTLRRSGRVIVRRTLTVR